MSTLIILVGLPGTGKSSWISQHSDNFIIISSNEIQDLVFGKAKSEQNNKTVEAYKIEIIQKSLEYGQNVIVDGHNLTKEDRQKILNIVPDNINKKAIYFPADLEKVIQRFKRSHDYKRDTITKMFKRLEIPSVDEGFDEVTII